MLHIPSHSFDPGESLFFSLYATSAQKRRIERYLLYYHLGQMWLSRH